MRHSGSDAFTYNKQEMLFELKDFWEYYASDILESSIRGGIAEFIITKALNTNNVMSGWTPFDVMYRAYRIEVKSSSYVHSTTTNRLTKPSFSISKHQVYLDETKWTAPKRNSDYYIFALLSCKDVKTADPMKLEQWEFYIVPTKYLDEHYDSSKSISLSVVQSISKKTDYFSLKETLDNMILSSEGAGSASNVQPDNISTNEDGVDE